MRILALIPARGGSKRLPRKNILPLGGKPLIVWSIDVAKDIPEICDILVSTDDPEIAEIAKQAGALVPWLRPAELATDTATSVDVVLHALDWYEKEKGKIDGLLLLQPTSPFRTTKFIQAGIELFQSDMNASVISVSPTHSHPAWTFKIENDHLTPFSSDYNINTRSQDLPAAYMLNGAFYLIHPKIFAEKKSFFDVKIIPLLDKSKYTSIDIDSELDFEIASCFLSRHMSSTP